MNGALCVRGCTRYLTFSMFLCPVALQPMQNLIFDTIAYTRERLAFGKPVLNNQVVHYELAELETELELLRSLLYRTVCELRCRF